MVEECGDDTEGDSPQIRQEGEYMSVILEVRVSKEFRSSLVYFLSLAINLLRYV
jgi:hypothetical protein